MKKLFLLLAVALCAINSTSVVSASLLQEAISDPTTILTSLEAKPPIFSDITSETPYIDAISWMKDNEIISGYADGTFKADNCVNRVEFLKMLFKVQNIAVNTTASQQKLFKDTPADAWYAPYLKVAKEKGTINGYQDGSFKPAQCINRAEAAKIAALSFNNNQLPGLTGKEESFINAAFFKDVKENDWYFNYLSYSLNKNVIGQEHISYDIDGPKFKPNDSMTRKEAAELLYRSKTLADRAELAYVDGQHPVIPSTEIFTNTCNSDSTKIAGDPDLLAVLPANASFVVGIDHSNASQIKNLTTIFKTLSGETFWKDMIKEYDASAETDAKYSDFNKILGADWEGVFGMLAQANSDPNNALENADLFLAGKFTKSDDFEKAFGKIIADDMNNKVTCVKSNGITYWTSTDKGFFYARRGNIFFVTNSDAARKQVLARLNQGQGFTFTNDYNKNKLGYLFVNSSLIKSLNNYFAELYGSKFNSISLEGLGDSYGALSSDDQGFTFSTTSAITNSSNEMLNNYRNYQPTFVNKVPGKNTLFYMEDADFSTAIKAMALGTEENSYAQIISSAATTLSTSTDSLRALIETPYAISITSSDSILPTFSVYFKLTNNGKDAADKVIQYLKKTITDNIETMLPTDSTNESTFVTQSVTDSGLNKIVLNINNIPSGSENPEKIKTELLKSGVEFYYGVKNGDTLVFAFYPNFEANYGTNPLSADSTYQAAISKLNNVYGGKLSYVNLSNFADFLVKGLALVSDAELIPFGPSETEISNVTDILGLFKYMISSTKVESSAVESRTYLRMGK